MTTFNEAQHPREATGKFTDKPHTAPELSLGGSHADVSAVASYPEYGFPTPRHTKPRNFTREVEVSLHIRNVTSEDAPVGMTGGQLTLRVVDGKLYRHAHEGAIESSLHVPGKEQIPGIIRELEETYVLIDGEPWMRTAEPVYFAQTFGLPHTQSGTSLSTTIPENSEHAYSDVFLASEFEEAKAEAIRVALERGDTNSVERIQDSRQTLHYTDAFVPGSTFRRAPQLQYTSLYDAKFSDSRLSKSERRARVQEAYRGMR